MRTMAVLQAQRHHIGNYTSPADGYKIIVWTDVPFHLAMRGTHRMI